MIGGGVVVKIVKKSLPQQIADAIEQKIHDKEYLVGDKLPTEPNLVEYFGVSRNTVREAIQSLAHSGLLETRQGDGTYVVAQEKLQVEFFNIMNSATYQNVLEVRELLEKHIVVSAIRNCTDEDIAEMKKYLLRRKGEESSLRETTQADLDFHIAIAAATHNEIILSMYKYISKYIQDVIYQKTHNMDHDQDYIDEIHDRLFHAIEDRDVDTALECVNRIVKD